MLRSPKRWPFHALLSFCFPERSPGSEMESHLHVVLIRKPVGGDVPGVVLVNQLSIKIPEKLRYELMNLNLVTVLAVN